MKSHDISQQKHPSHLLLGSTGAEWLCVEWCEPTSQTSPYSPKSPDFAWPPPPSTLLNTFIPTYLSSVTWAQGNGLTRYFSSSLSSIYQVFPISQVQCQWLGFSGESAHTYLGHFLLRSHSASIGFQILHPHLHSDFHWVTLGCPQEPKKWWQEVGRINRNFLGWTIWAQKILGEGSSYSWILGLKGSRGPGIGQEEERTFAFCR